MKPLNAVMLSEFFTCIEHTMPISIFVLTEFSVSQFAKPGYRLLRSHQKQLSKIQKYGAVWIEEYTISYLHLRKHYWDPGLGSGSKQLETKTTSSSVAFVVLQLIKRMSFGVGECFGTNIKCWVI